MRLACETSLVRFQEAFPFQFERCFPDILEILPPTSHSVFKVMSSLGPLFRATFHMKIKRERPLILTRSFYIKIIMHYHFYLKQIMERE